MRSFSRIAASSSFAVGLSSSSSSSSSTTTNAISNSRRTMMKLQVGATDIQPAFTKEGLNKIVNKNGSGLTVAQNKGANLSAAFTGSTFNYVYNDEEMFEPFAAAKADAKKTQFFGNGHQSKYVIPSDKVTKEVAAEALAVFDRFAKDVSQVELLYRKFIRSFPATVHLLGTKAEIAAFEATEAAKIPNNKLIVGRVNANSGLPVVNIREELFHFYSTLFFMAANNSAEEIAKYAAPVVERFITESYLSRQYLWRFQEEIVRSIEATTINGAAVPATPYDIRVVSEVSEYFTKIVFNAIADLPWACESYSDINRGLDLTVTRACAEAGMW